MAELLHSMFVPLSLPSHSGERGGCPVDRRDPASRAGEFNGRVRIRVLMSASARLPLHSPLKLDRPFFCPRFLFPIHRWPAAGDGTSQASLSFPHPRTLRRAWSSLLRPVSCCATSGSTSAREDTSAPALRGLLANGLRAFSLELAAPAPSLPLVGPFSCRMAAAASSATQSKGVAIRA